MIIGLTIAAILSLLCGSFIAFKIGDDEELPVKSSSFFLLAIALLLLAILIKINPFW